MSPADFEDSLEKGCILHLYESSWKGKASPHPLDSNFIFSLIGYKHFAGNYELRVDMKNSYGTRAAAKFSTFAVEGEAMLYRLSIAGYSYDPTLADPGDSLATNNGSTLFVVLCLTLANWTYCLECYSCMSVTDQLSCNQTKRCEQNEVCFTDRRDASFTFGCTPNQQCGLGPQAGTLIGRDLNIRQLSNCHECCSTDLCNSILCVHSQPSACVDDETVDCAKMNTLFGICADVHKAKLVCAKFCNLCTMVDGKWSVWSSWSVCSVTCENGQHTRQRTCTNPAPANGGLNCNGTSLDTKSCSLEACPVHGGWATWSDWGICSVSCDVGMQRRERTCSNPYPARNGNHCFGDPSEYRICMPRACANGSWSVWGSWTSCSDICGEGVKTRERSCTNPHPSIIGEPCIGNSVQSTTCNRNHCRENCKVLLENGDAITGFKTILLDEDGIHSLSALCINDVDGGGWTVIQQRESASDFYKNWTEYKRGFGDMTNFWIGLDNIHLLTSQRNYELRVDMKRSNGERAAAKYGAFAVGSEKTMYNLSVADYSYDLTLVNPGDSLPHHNGMKFSTYDRDNDMAGSNCAESSKGGYWYNHCHDSNLNGVYGSTASSVGINWWTWTGLEESLIFTRMMIRPK